MRASLPADIRRIDDPPDLPEQFYKIMNCDLATDGKKLAFCQLKCSRLLRKSKLCAILIKIQYSLKLIHQKTDFKEAGSYMADEV